MRLRWEWKGQKMSNIRRTEEFDKWWWRPVFRATGDKNVKGLCRMLSLLSHAQICRHVHDDMQKHFALCPSVTVPVGLPPPFVFELQYMCMSKSSLATQTGRGTISQFREAWINSTCHAVYESLINDTSSTASSNMNHSHCQLFLCFSQLPPWVSFMSSWSPSDAKKITIPSLCSQCSQMHTYTLSPFAWYYILWEHS